MRRRRVQAVFAATGAGLLALFALGCPEPADLQDPGQYPAPLATAGSGTTGGTSGGGSAGASYAACEVACVTAVFQSPATCGICHNNDQGAPITFAGLDLKSPGYSARLVNVPAMHTDLGAGMSAADCPTGDKLIDTANPAASWLLKKVKNEQVNCGTEMPAGNPLSAAQIACLETYAACVAGGAVAPGGGGGTGGT